MKNKNKFKLIGSGLLFTSSIVAAISVVAAQGSMVSIINQEESALNANNNGNNEFKYLFNNKYYDSLDDITNELVNNNKYINDDLYYGDAGNAIFDHQTNQLNINELKKFDQNKISSAYVNAFGGYEQDFNKAKKSFVNEGLVKYKYQDTKGVLHSSYSEAQREILKGIKVDETVFYEVYDEEKNTTVKINPLNKDDINKMKEITLRNAKEQVKDPNNKNNTFGMMPMLNIAKNKDDGNFVALSDTSWLNNLFTKNISDFYNEITDDFATAMTETFMESVFKATVKLNYTHDDLAYNLEKISGTEFPDLTTKTVKGRERLDTMTFKEVDYANLNKFDVFLNRKTWIKENGVEGVVQYAGPVKQADNLIFTNFLRKTAKFKLFSTGDDGPWTVTNTNTQILQPGSHSVNGKKGNQIDFDVNFQLENEAKFVESIKIKLMDKWKPETSTKQIETTLIEEQFKNNIIESMTDTMMFSEINSKYFNVEYNKYSSNNELKMVEKLSFIFRDIKNQYDNEYKAIDNNKFIIDQFLLTYKKMNYFLTYNKSPIFKINDSFVFENFALPETFFYKQYLDKFYETYNSENLSNISNNISGDGKNISSNNAFVKTKIMADKLFSFTETEHQGTLTSTKDEVPHKYDNLVYALSSYNDNLSELKTKYSNVLPENIKNKLIDNENNILVLTDPVASGINRKTSELHYGEYISLVYDFNESLSSTSDNKKIIYNTPELESVKLTSNKINPAKVIIIYDLFGNVINPGIQLSDDLAMETTSDAMYDSEQTILDNIYRTLIVKNDPNKIYYKNDNETYTLLDFETNFIYELGYNNKTHHFLTYKDAWLYLRDIIKLEAQRISVKEK